MSQNHRQGVVAIPRFFRGFTLIELMVTIGLLALLMMLAMPSFSTWIRNAKIRVVTDSLQNGLRVAQTESLRRNRQVVFSLTNAQPALNAAAAANGRNWSVQTVAQFGETSGEFIQGGALSDVASGVTITGPTAVCFSSNGRLVANATGTGVPNATCSAADAQFNVDQAVGEHRALRVAVGLGGRVRMCDPARSLSSTTPDGC